MRGSSNVALAPTRLELLPKSSDAPGASRLNTNRNKFPPRRLARVPGPATPGSVPLDAAGVRAGPDAS